MGLFFCSRSPSFFLFFFCRVFWPLALLPFGFFVLFKFEEKEELVSAAQKVPSRKGSVEGL